MFLSLGRKTGQAQAQGTEVELLHNPQFALSVFQSVEYHWFVSSARTKSSPDPPVVRHVVVAVPCHLVTHNVAALPRIVSPWCTRFCIVYTSWPLVRTSCKLGTVSLEEAQQCFHAMLLGQPSWPAPLDGGF